MFIHDHGSKCFWKSFTCLMLLQTGGPPTQVFSLTLAEWISFLNCVGV